MSSLFSRHDERVIRRITTFRTMIFWVTAVLMIPLSQAQAFMERPKKAIAAGDRVVLHFTCRQKSGEIIKTTRQSLADDPAHTKSTVFEPLRHYAPLELTAGQGQQYYSKKNDPLIPFNEELMAQLSDKVVGMHVGESRTLTLSADVPKEIKEGERFIRIARESYRGRQRTVDREIFQKQYDMVPEMGKIVKMGNGLQEEIVKLTDKEVHLRYLKEADKLQVNTQWGPATVSFVGDDKVKMTYDNKVGRLVRLRQWVGRIAKIEKGFFTLDYGYPFGEESVLCDVSILSVNGEPKMAPPK